MQRTKFYTHEHTEYDDEPVHYCKSCHSLCILVDDALSDEDWDGAYCADCHSTDIGTCSIDEWLVEEKRRKAIEEAREWNK